MAVILTPAHNGPFPDNRKMVFLAGPIQGAENWQLRAINDLADFDIYIANPRREKNDNFVYARQVDWETEHLRRADIVMFWLPPEAEHIEGRSYAQTSRFELGEWLGRTDFNRLPGKKVIVGAAPGFSGRRYFCQRAAHSPLEVYDSYEETINTVRRELSKPLPCKRVFFTSDTHFGSARTLELSRRPFADVEEMNRTLVANWNRTVNPGDDVWHLGDFGDLKWVPALNGTIHLILGNYEIDTAKQNPDYRRRLETVFAGVELSREIVTADGEKLHLSHKPSGHNPEMFNAFGHIHGRQTCKKFGIDVGVDAHAYTPLSEADLLFYKKAIFECFDEEVFL